MRRSRGKAMRRRDFIKVMAGSAAVAWPLAARAQQSEQMRRIGVLMPFAKDNPDPQARITAFLQELQKLGWTEGRNLQIEYRWGTGDGDQPQDGQGTWPHCAAFAPFPR